MSQTDWFGVCFFTFDVWSWVIYLCFLKTSDWCLEGLLNYLHFVPAVPDMQKLVNR